LCQSFHVDLETAKTKKAASDRFLPQHRVVQRFGDQAIRGCSVAAPWQRRNGGSEGTVVELAEEKEEVRLLLEGGMTMADAVLPLTAPQEIEQLTFFE
jgi:hypothetical protein